MLKSCLTVFRSWCSNNGGQYQRLGGRLQVDSNWKKLVENYRASVDSPLPHGWVWSLPINYKLCNCMKFYKRAGSWPPRICVCTNCTSLFKHGRRLLKLPAMNESGTQIASVAFLLFSSYCYRWFDGGYLTWNNCCGKPLTHSDDSDAWKIFSSLQNQNEMAKVI